MKRINVAKKFKLHTTSKTGVPEYHDYEPGSHVVPDEHADHWYTKLHLQPQSEIDLKRKLEEEQDLASDAVAVQVEEPAPAKVEDKKLTLKKGK